ncbi:MAG: prolyl oligopeptidase family serine peptidase [Pirellulaceae bacterium]
MMKPFFLFSLSAMFLMAQGITQAQYRLPPKDVVDIIDAKPEPGVGFSPDGKWMVLTHRDAMPDIEALGRRMLQLAGTRLDPVANSRFQTDFLRGVSLQKTGDKNSVSIVPSDSNNRISGMAWSHDSRHFAWTQVKDNGTELWVASVERPTEPRRLTERLSTVLSDWSFSPDGNSVICTLVPESRGNEPIKDVRPAGPNIQESIGLTSPTRTYQDLLTNSDDENLFEYYATTQLAVIGLDGKTKLLGKPSMIMSCEVSPDGKLLMVGNLERPFSFLMPYSSFPNEISIWNLAGEKLKTVVRNPLEENIPIEGVPVGPRSIRWAANEDARLFWFEALDGGDPRVKVPHRDRVMSWKAPFTDSPAEIMKVEHRAVGMSFFAKPGMVAVSEMDRDRRWLRTQMHDLNDTNFAVKTLDDRSMRDRYGDPGRMITRSEKTGHAIVRQDGEWVYLAGQGATPEGDVPFLDRKSLTTLKTERLWLCEKGWMESVALLLSSTADAKPTIITRRESSTVPPNYFQNDLAGGTKTQLTSFVDPTPQIRGIRKELVKYTRADGVPLSATLYLPANYQPGQRLPLMIWAYPLEFNDPSTAGQVSANPNQFTRISGLSHLALLTQGYAIMDNATMPVVGDPETMNNTFVEQIVSSAQAAIDKAVEMGVADRDRVCVGGHSYGAFMTANLLAHCDLFRAGVARSGAYNRTLTPFGFQSERRPFWQAKEIYMNISPFTHADKIKRPLLLVHGENDNNAGTFPIQSQRLYQAIKGNGGVVRLVMLPLESHGYRARESVLHTHAETIDWLNKYVRDATGAPPADAKKAGSE